MTEGRNKKIGISLTLVLLILTGGFFALVTTMPVGVRAATLYVGGTGPSNYTTIQLAIDAATPGDTIFVFNGTYHEQILIAKPLTLVGEGRDVTVIDGDNLALRVVNITANWVNFTGFTVKNGSSGLFAAGLALYGADNCRILANNISSNRELGIYLESASNNTISYNEVDDNAGLMGAGIHFNYSSNNTVNNNSASGNDYGMYLVSSDNNTVQGNNVSANRDRGMYLWGAKGNGILNNSIRDNVGEGIFLQYSENNTIAGNNVSSNFLGVRLGYSGNNTIDGNNLTDSGDRAIYIATSHRNKIANNSILGNGYDGGVLLWSTYDDVVENNNFRYLYSSAIELSRSVRSTLANNTMEDGGIFITAEPYPNQSLDYWNTHSIDTSNTVRGKPVRYWTDVVGGSVPAGAGQVILANCTGVMVQDQNVSAVMVGVESGFSTGLTVRNVTVTQGRIGVLLFRSQGVSIENTSADGGSDGVLLYYSDGNTILGGWSAYSERGYRLDHSHLNDIANIAAIGNVHGVDLTSSNLNDISGNAFLSNDIGFTASTSDGNILFENNFSNNNLGARLQGSFSNWLYHNSFSPNLIQASDDGTNRWNDSYPSGGNYWSDYTGADAMHGPGQNLAGGDGMGDTPYAVTAGANQDNYPLMRGYPPSPRAPPTEPLNLQAVAGNAQVSLSWNPPNWDGFAAVTNYSIYRGTTSGMESYLTTIGNVTTFLNTGLTNGVTYYYKVAAINIEGEGPKSNEASARPATIPGPPQSLIATPSDRRIDLAWAAPASNGGSTITNYAVYRGTTPGGETLLVTLGNVLSHSDTGLTNGQTYYYLVAAINGIGHGPNSTEASATPLAVPSEPNNLQGTSGNQQITLTWSAPVSDGGSPITNYSIYRGIVPGATVFFAEIGNVLTYMDLGLVNGQTYYYQVAAKNGLGEGLKTPEIAVTPGVTPGPPVGLVATPGNRQITLTWSPPIDNGGLPVTAYSVYRGDVPGGETLLITVGNVLTYTNTGLSNGRIYYYKVSAWNAMGEGPMSGEASATPSVRPSEPADLAAIAGIGQITVMWLPPIDNGGSAIVGYNVYRGTSPGNEALFVSLGNVLTYVDGGLPNGITYYYMVSAVNVIGEGPRSIEKSATTPKEPSEPRSLQAAAGDGQIGLGWIAPVSDGGMTVRNYEIYRSTASGMEVFLIEVGNVLSHVDTGLVNGQTYYYQVSAKNDVAEGQRSTEVSASPTSPATVPAAPQNLQAVAANRRVTLTWLEPSSDGGATIIGYRIFAGTSPSSKTLVAQIGNVLTYADTALTNGVTYYYEVAAVNGVGEGASSNEASGTPRSVPGQPLSFTAAAGNGNVALSWNAPADDGGAAITGYKVYRGTQSGGLVLHATLGDVLSYLDPSLTNSRVYYYKVTAINAVGEGPDSGTISATPWNRAPTCIIDDPLYLASVSGTVTVAGTASDQDGTVVRVEISIDGGSWTTVDGTTSWTYSWDTKSVSDGRRTINARSFDGDSYSNLAKVTVNVANEAPKGQDSSLVFALVIVIVLVLVAFYFLWFRRRNVKEEKPPRK